MAEFSDAETLEVGPNDEVGLLSNLLKSEKPPSDRVVVRKGTVEDVHTTGKTQSHAIFLSLKKKQSCICLHAFIMSGILHLVQSELLLCLKENAFVTVSPSEKNIILIL